MPLLERVPPHNFDAERALLGCMMLCPDAARQAVTLVTPQDFYAPEHAILCDAIIALYGDGANVDLVTTEDLLRNRGVLDDVGGTSAIVDIVSSVPSTANARDYAHIVLDKSRRRSAIAAMSQRAFDLYDGGIHTEKSLSQAITDLSTVQGRGDESDIVDVAQAIAELDNMDTEESVVSVPCPLLPLNNVLGGYQGDGLYIIAGQAGTGKTMLAHQSIVEAAAHDKHTLLFSCEMPPREVAARLLSQVSGVPVGIREGRMSYPETQEDAVARAGEWLVEHGRPYINILRDSNVTVDHVEAKASEMHRLGRCDMVVVDYLQLMTPPEAPTRAEAVGMMTRRLKQMAMRLHIPVLALSQLNRKVDARGNYARPRLGDLKDSGSIEQDANVVIFAHRPDMNSENTEDREHASLVVAKNRGGQLVDIHVRFDEGGLRFVPRGVL